MRLAEDTIRHLHTDQDPRAQRAVTLARAVLELSEVRQPGSCQCGDDEACRFVRERDEARAEVEQWKKRWRVASDAAQLAQDEVKRLRGALENARPSEDLARKALRTIESNHANRHRTMYQYALAVLTAHNAARTALADADAEVNDE